MAGEVSVGLADFWAFARARQQLLYTGQTDDPILQQYRFTNCYRACDRVSQYLILNIHSIPEMILFKVFNRISTWEFLRDKGLVQAWVDCGDDPSESVIQAVGDALQHRVCFSPAYRMCLGRTTYGFREKHRNWLWAAASVANLTEDLAQERSLQGVFNKLIELPMFGRFLAMQIAIDIGYLTGLDENEFIMVGPGSRRGIHTVYEGMRRERVNLSGDDERYQGLVEDATASQEFDPMPLGMNGGATRRLHLIDVQNLFCEFDKYTRIRNPEIQLVAKTKKRPKQNYMPSYPPRIWPDDYVFPKGWYA